MHAHLSTALALAAALTEKFGYQDEPFEVTEGRQYARIVRCEAPGGPSGRSAYAFVDVRTAALLKAAGWTRPAPGARYDLSTPEGFEQALADADRFGRFLYRR